MNGQTEAAWQRSVTHGWFEVILFSSRKRFTCVRELFANRYWSTKIELGWGPGENKKQQGQSENLVVCMKNFFSISIITFWKIFTNIAHISHTRSANCFPEIYSTFSAIYRKPCARRSQTQYTRRVHADGPGSISGPGPSIVLAWICGWLMW